MESRHTDQIKTRAKRLLEVVLQRFLVDGMSVPVICCASHQITVRRVSARSAGGAQVQCLSIDNGEFYVGELRRLGHNALWWNFLGLRAPMGGKVSMKQVLPRVFSCGRKSQWLASKLINMVGILMEADFPDRGFINDPFIARGPASQSATRRRCLEARGLLGRSALRGSITPRKQPPSCGSQGGRPPASQTSRTTSGWCGISLPLALLSMGRSLLPCVWTPAASSRPVGSWVQCRREWMARIFRWWHGLRRRQSLYRSGLTERA